jgi:hypothetical protein
MKKLLYLLFFAALMVGCSEDEETSPPPFAASTTTWTFGDQTWSDAIHCPECNKETFENSNTDPKCRSYTENGKTRYYYNWAYIEANKATMCPNPWRVPTQQDFEQLANNTNADDLISAWGYGGYTWGSSMSEVDSEVIYWSSTEYDSIGAYLLLYKSGYLGVSATYKYTGFQVRCVR